MMTTVVMRGGAALGDLTMTACRGGGGGGGGGGSGGVVAKKTWMVRASPSAQGKVAAQDEVIHCQKASLVHSNLTFDVNLIRAWL